MTDTACRRNELADVSGVIIVIIINVALLTTQHRGASVQIHTHKHCSGPTR